MSRVIVGKVVVKTKTTIIQYVEGVCTESNRFNQQLAEMEKVADVLGLIGCERDQYIIDCMQFDTTTKEDDYYDSLASDFEF